MWEDPPPQGKNGAPPGRGKLALLAAELQEHPGKWAFVGSYSFPNGEGQAKLKRLGCEAVTRGLGGGLYGLYARWPEDAS